MSHKQERERAYYLKHREKIIARSAARYAEKHEEILAKEKAWRVENPKEARAECVKHYWANREKMLAKARRYYAENSGPAKRRAHEWRLKNPEACVVNDRIKHLKRPEHYRALHRSWSHRERLARPEKFTIANGRRRAVRASATLPGYEAEIASVYRVAAERSRAEGVKYSVDHIWPLQGKRASGLHVPWNLQVMELTANKAKGNREPEFAR